MNGIFSLPVLFQTLSSALSVLTAMLTPALLLSACGSFIISTSNRLGRVVDRVRKLSERMEELLRSDDPDVAFLEERMKMVQKHMELQSRRASLLMRTMVSLYYASGLFVLTSVSIGIVSIFSSNWSWVPVVFGVMGAIMLLVATIRLVTEAKLALEGLHEETDFLQKITTKHYERAQDSKSKDEFTA